MSATLRHLAFGLAFAGPAFAQPGTVAPAADDTPPATIERDVHLFVVQKDGSIDERDDTVLRANTTAGVDAIAQRYVWFNKDIESITQLSAATLDADGREHPVGPDAIRDVQEPRSAGAPMFEDGVLRSVIFPGVQPGSRVHLTFEKRREKSSSPGGFSYSVEPSGDPVDYQQLIFDLPQDVPLHIDARGYTALAPVTAEGRTRYTFEYRHGPYAPAEPGAAAYANWGDHLLVSTVPDYAAFAERYRIDAADPTATDPSIAALALALTADVTDPRDKARRIYDWMRFNIRYVALYLGQTETMPHHAIDILRNRYGDCKDHVALFVALLSAVGIRAEPVLLNLGTLYSLPSVPGYGGDAIDHAITWLPDLGVFADTSSGGIAFGYLPGAELDRPVLLVDDATLVRTPSAQPRTRSARLAISVGDDGNASYAYRVDDAGASAEPERNVFRRATHQRAQRIAADRLRMTGLSGTARIDTDAVAPTSGPFGTTMHGTIDHLVWTDGTTALPALSSLSGGIRTQVDAWLAEPRRTQPFVCIDGDFDETAQIALPANVRVTDVPADASVDGPDVMFLSHYVFDDASRTLQVTRRLTTHFGRQMCTPEEFARMRDALVRIERDTHAQIVVRAAAKGRTTPRAD
jgi:transglutaminase-like putative cysteine protease